MKILIVEDDNEVAELIKEALEQQNFVVKIVNSGEEGLFEGQDGDYDGIVLDLGLPDKDGMSVLEEWRENGLKTPVIVLTARDDLASTIKGLESGADDYVVKGTSIGEIVARVQANIKRSKEQTAKQLISGDIVFDIASQRFSKDGVGISLTEMQFLILQYLFLKQGTTVSITELTEHVYDDFDHDFNSMHRHIYKIRKKLGQDIVQTDTDRGYYVPKNEG